MKTSSVFDAMRAGVIFLFASTAALSASEITVKDPLALKVQVNMPPTWNLLVTDHLADDLTDGVRQLLTERGYRRAVEPLNYVDRPGQAPYLLTINLLEWRMGRTGLIDFTMSASLQAPRGTRELGIYNYSSLHLRGAGRSMLARDFDEAASGALNKLCDDIARSEMLPDFVERAS